MELLINVRPLCENCGAPAHPAEVLVNGYCTDCWLWLLNNVDEELDSFWIM